MNIGLGLILIPFSIIIILFSLFLFNMKLNIIILSVIGMVLLLSAFSFSYTFPRSDHHTFTKTTDLSKENIEGFLLKDDFYNEEITKKYGKKQNKVGM